MTSNLLLSDNPRSAFLFIHTLPLHPIATKHPKRRHFLDAPCVCRWLMERFTYFHSAACRPARGCCCGRSGHHGDICWSFSFLVIKTIPLWPSSNVMGANRTPHTALRVAEEPHPQACRDNRKQIQAIN